MTEQAIRAILIHIILKNGSQHFMAQFTKTISILALTCFIAGCTSSIGNHGYEVDSADFSQVRIGLDRQEDIIKRLGSPSSTSTFSPTVWYYVSKETTTTAFFTPKTRKQKVITITFNDAGVVTAVQDIKDENFKEVVPNKNVTETTGYQSGILREIFSNFGRMGTKKPTRS